MLGVFAVVAALASSAVSPNAEDARGIHLAGDPSARSASLLGGLSLDGTYRPSAMEPLRLTDALRFTAQGAPSPLDDGGALSQDIRQILALILGFIPGFGIGHLIARDRDGFILFLIIDIALYAVGVTLGWVFGGTIFWGVGGLVWLVVHIIQALDAYAEAGGERIVERMRERAVEVAVSPGRETPIVTTRALGFSF